MKGTVVWCVATLIWIVVASMALHTGMTVLAAVFFATAVLNGIVVAAMVFDDQKKSL